MKSLTQHWWLWGVKHKAVIFISTFTRFGIQNGGKYCVRKDFTRWHIAKHTANSRKKIFSKAKLHEKENERKYKRELWWLRAKASVQDGVSEWARDDKNGKALDFAILKRHSEWIFFSNQSIDGFSGKIFVARCITAHSMHCSLHSTCEPSFEYTMWKEQQQQSENWANENDGIILFRTTNIFRHFSLAHFLRIARTVCCSIVEFH